MNFCNMYNLRTSRGIHKTGTRARLPGPHFRQFSVTSAVVNHVREAYQLNNQAIEVDCGATMTTSSSTPCDAVLAVLERVDAESSAQLVDFIAREAHISGCYAFFGGALPRVLRADAV